MIRHIIKLVWNRKKSVSLLLVEIFLSFIVAFVVGDILITAAINYAGPIGYDYENLYDVRIGVPGGKPFGKLGAENSAKYLLLLSEMKSFPGVREVSYVSGNIPYGRMRISSVFDYNGKAIDGGYNYVDDEFLAAMGMSLIEGRWFGPEDNAAIDKPIIIDEVLRTRIFGEGRAVGESLLDKIEDDQGERTEKYNIIGVVSTFRPEGELGDTEGEFFLRQLWDDSSYIPLAAMVRVHEGTSVSFELNLQRRLSALAPGFDFRILPLSEAREAKLQEEGVAILTPLVIAVFLLFNVALGLFGIFWQSISRRRGEIGLRRALGANSRTLPLQIWGETVALGTLAILAGIPVAVNLAVLGISKPIGTPVFFLSLVCAGGLIYLILTVCALYPSSLATRIQPAEALHDE